ncbi:MAG: site-2 protease family protein [Rothia sp. (in: high G+C Gram-positive bacteria)]|nr:site-2 protease family protein [Rothia sp. (in: high G+C Gram-positive bacteria)]
MSILLFIAGVIFMVIAIALSIALHEIGHLTPAKLFNVRVPQYMIGFGKTLFSFRRGETEYGVKAIPLGGYISMIGMYPPGSSKKAGRFADIFEQARAADADRITEHDQGRLFYQLPIYKRMIIMLGGPFMNLLIGTLCIAVLIMGFGRQEPTTTVSSVSQCVHQVSATEVNSDSAQDCTSADPASPALQAGLKPGDEITSFAGEKVESWDQLSGLIQTHADSTVPMTVMRDGQEKTLDIKPMLTVRPIFNDLTGQYEKNSDGTYKTEQVGFAGIGPTSELKPGSSSEVLPTVGANLHQIGTTIIKLPARVFGVAQAVVTNGERAADSPVSVVGVGRVAGEIASTDKIDLKAKFATLISLTGSLNLMLFTFNLIPLLPLDGGHVFGAVWEGLRKLWAKIRGKENPGPFDPVRLLPLTWVVAGAFMMMSLILIVADVVKPVSVF